MNGNGTIDSSRAELRQKLLEINVWAMLLIIALVLERASNSVVVIAAAWRNVDAREWAALFMMALVFGLLLATTVGILALHVRFGAPYSYWYVVLDNVFVTVPLYIAVRFISASIGETTTTVVHLDENLLRVGATMIALSFVFLFVRDLIVLPKIRTRIAVPPLVAVSALHLLGAVLFISLAVVPGFVIYVAVTGTIGLGFFFAGMVAIPLIEARFTMNKPTTAADAGVVR
jgi:hypothetical protein